MILQGRDHVALLAGALSALEGDLDRIERWGRQLARLLAAGNGGSAAQAQHLATELVGRYRSDERPPLAALALCADTTALTAIGNDYGLDEAFARQVRAHGRPGDVLVALSTSGTSGNVLAAARAALDGGLTVWALTGTAPNALAELADDALCPDVDYTPTVQEIHLVAIHLLCAAVDAALTESPDIASNRLLLGNTRAR